MSSKKHQEYEAGFKHAKEYRCSVAQPLAQQRKHPVSAPLVNTVRDGSYWIDNIISRSSRCGSCSSIRVSTR